MNEESPLISKDITKEFVHDRVELVSMELHTMYLGYMAWFGPYECIILQDNLGFASC